MLRACRALLHPLGRLAFMAIHPAPGLGEADTRRALIAGPRAVSTRRRSYGELLTAAGFEAIEVVDLTDDYRETLGLLIHHQELHAEELGRLSGVESFGGAAGRAAGSAGGDRRGSPETLSLSRPALHDGAADESRSPSSSS